MTYLHDKLSSLYAERADLLERIQREITDPAAAERITAASNNAHGPFAMGEILAATMPTKLAIDRLKVEIAWTEKQILAILGNSGLGKEAPDDLD